MTLAVTGIGVAHISRSDAKKISRNVVPGRQLFYTFAHRLEKQADKHSQHLIIR